MTRLAWSPVDGSRFATKAWGVLPRSRSRTQWSGLAGAAGGPITRYRDAVAADTPVAYYHLAEPSGTSAADSAGAFTGTYVNAPTLGATSAVSDTGDTAVTFASASSQRVTAASPTAVTNNFALEGWGKLAAVVAQNGLFAHNGSTDANGWAFGVGDGAGATGLLFVGLVPGVAWVVTNYTFADTNFHHLAIVRRAGTFEAYVDGVAVTVTAGAAAVPVAPSTNFSIAAERFDATPTYTRHFNGTIDEIAVYATAPSAARIAAHFAAR